MALRTTQIKNALLKYDTKWSDKEQKSSFANAIHDIYNNLPDKEEDRELSNDELYESIFCIINFSHSKLTKAEKKLLGKLYSKQCEQDTHLIHRMKFLSFLFEYNLLNQESYHYFYYEFNSLNLEDLQTQLFYLIQHKLLTPTIFNRLYTHNSIILLDACFIKTFQQIITSDYFEKIINYRDLPSLKQFCDINRNRWPKSILSAVLDHQNCLPLVLFYNNISSEDLLFFLTMDNQSTVIGILNHLHRITMKTPFDISAFLRQKNHDENMALLEKLNAQQIARYSNFFLTNTNFQDFAYFIAASEQLELQYEGRSTLSDTLLIAFQDITRFSYILITKRLSYHNDDYADYLCLHNAIKTQSIHANHPLIAWLETHKEKSRPDMHKLLLRHQLNDTPLSILNDISDDYPHLIDYIYNKNPILGRINKLMLYLLRLSIPKPDVYCHLDNFIDSIFLMKTQKKLSLVNTHFSFNSNALHIKNRYNQLLALSPIHYQIPFEQFIDTYQLALNALYFALPTRYEKTLLSLLNTSVIQLHDFLDTVTQFINDRQFEITYYLAHYILYQLGRTLKKPASLKKSLTYLLFKLNSSHNNAMDDTILFFEKPGINDHDLLEHFHIYTVTTLSKNLGIQLTEKTTAFSFKELSTLSLAYQQHQKHSYISILKTLITYHCLNQSVFDFLHDNNQESSLGKEIALRNTLTQNALVAAGVNPSVLMNYPYKKTIYVFGKNTRICNELTLEIWLMSGRLLEQINLDINENKCLIIIQNNLKNFICQISKKLKGRPLSEDDNDMLSFIRNDANMHLLTTMLKQCEALLLINALKESLTEIMITDFSKKIKHLSESLDLKKYSRNDDDWKKPERYTLKIWDKTDNKTFFLGDQVGCCLAAKNGPMFPAILERIIDDAMQIMMVIDESTHEAVAGMWLYVAQDKATKHAYLVANFTEMRSGIAKKQPLLRDALLTEMLKFTKEFASAMKIPFVMAPLDYGCLDNWKFDLIKHKFEKIGFMSLGCNYTQYYIKSLREKQFYHYDETKINEIYPLANNSIIESRTEVISSALNRAPISPFLHKHGIFKHRTESSADNSQPRHLLYQCNPP